MDYRKFKFKLPVRVTCSQPECAVTGMMLNGTLAMSEPRSLSLSLGTPASHVRVTCSAARHVDRGTVPTKHQHGVSISRVPRRRTPGGRAAAALLLSEARRAARGASARLAGGGAPPCPAQPGSESVRYLHGLDASSWPPCLAGVAGPGPGLVTVTSPSKLECPAEDRASEVYS